MQLPLIFLVLSHSHPGCVIILTILFFFLAVDHSNFPAIVLLCSRLLGSGTLNLRRFFGGEHFHCKFNFTRYCILQLVVLSSAFECVYRICTYISSNYQEEFIELQHARRKKFHRAPSVTYEITNCYTYMKDVQQQPIYNIGKY